MPCLVACHAGAGMHAPRLEGAYRSGDMPAPCSLELPSDQWQAQDAADPDNAICMPTALREACAAGLVELQQTSSPTAATAAAIVMLEVLDRPEGVAFHDCSDANNNNNVPLRAFWLDSCLHECACHTASAVHCYSS